jgi:hypothetical protein
MSKLSVAAETLSLYASSGVPATLPQVLTRDTIPKLAITSLDAGDVLECYYLTRNTLLHGTAIQLTKSALGLRYRHRPATGMKYDRRRLELTIEFGPARAGSTLSHESIPHVVEDQEIDNDLGSFTSSSVIWDNEGKIYYSEFIDSDTYSTANYLASVSGALLSKLLNSALDFLESSSNKYQRRRRYQPFSVYLASSIHSQPMTDPANMTEDVPQPKQLLKSSTDTDFLQYLFVSLAKMGVELKPVILPVVAEVRLHVVDMVKVQIGTSASPVMFYKKLLECVKAIGTTDYSVYNISKSIATSIPTPSPSFASPALSPTLPSMIVRPPRLEIQPASQMPVVSTPIPSIGIRNLRDRLLLNDAAVNSNFPVESPVLARSNSSLANPTVLPTLLPTISPQDKNMNMVKHQEQAASAAQQAQEAADAAGAADTEDEAVSAAQQAAAYAQKAASVTANQAALMARDAITSGVGNSVAQAVSLCFSDSIYGIAGPSSSKTWNSSSAKSGDNVSATIIPPSPTVYLYWDGSFYYRMNLTAPYVTVVSHVRPMPKPLLIGIGREDFVDWSIALFIAVCAGVGFILLLQQVMGRSLKVIRPLYRFQRWFFQPTQFDWGQMVEESEASRAIGQGYMFGEDAIPLSMGGRKYENSSVGSEVFGSSVRNYGGSSWHGEFDEANESDHHKLGDMELVNRSQHRTPPLRTSGGGGVLRSYEKISSFHSDLDGDDDTNGNAVRLYRDPNYVDLPNLSSSSKVATPVSVSINE